MNVTELRKALEELEGEGKGRLPVVIRVIDHAGDHEFVESATLRPLVADALHAPDFEAGQKLLLVE